MSHPLTSITSVEILGDYVLRVRFEDGISSEIDLQPVLYGEMYGPLRDPALFRQVRLDPEVGTLVWPNGADFDPWTLHEWPKLVGKMSERARSWEAILQP